MRNVLVSGLIAAAGFQFSRDISVAYVGVQLNVLFACGMGTACAIAVSERIEDRKKLAGRAFASWFMGAAFTSICNATVAYWNPELKITDGLQAGMGAAVSFTTVFFLPWFIEEVRSGRWVDRIPFIKKRNGDNAP